MPIKKSVVDAWQFYRANGVVTSLHSKEAPWLIQFGKYGICGVLATVLHNAVVAVLSIWVIPALDSQGLEDAVRARNLVINNLIAFVFSTTFVYFANLLIVFERGRHHPVREFFYFTMVNFIAMVPALGITYFAASTGSRTPIAQLLFIITSVIVNFLARKFFVFRK